jgi:hypothetical protein
LRAAGRRLHLVGDDQVDDAVRRLHRRHRADRVGRDLAEAAAGDHRRPAHPQRGVLGGDDQVGAAGDHRVAGEAAAVDDGDPRHQPREPGPEREGADLEGGDDRVVGVAGTAAAALGEEDGGEAHPLDQLEQAVLLAVPEGALGAGQDRVVIGEDRAGGPLAEQLAVDPRGAAEEAVAGGAPDQVVELAPPPLGGDREAPVLDEGAGIDQVLEVLPRGAAAGRVAPLDRLRPRRVVGQLAPAEDLLEVFPSLRHRRHVRRSAQPESRRIGPASDLNLLIIYLTLLSYGGGP